MENPAIVDKFQLLELSAIAGFYCTISIAKLIFVRFPSQCKRKAFPDDPADAIHNEHAAAHVERGGYSKVPISDFDFVSLYENHVHYLVIECH